MRPGSPFASSRATSAEAKRSFAPETATDGSSCTMRREPVATASIAGVGATSPWASRSWLPTTGYQGASRPGEPNGRSAAASRPGWRGASTSGR